MNDQVPFRENMLTKTRIRQWFQRKKHSKPEDQQATDTASEPRMIIRISDLNHYVYCPKRAWYGLIAGERGDNAHLVEGAILHKRADSAEASTPRKGVKQRRTVTLYSRQYGLSGLADLVEEIGDRIYPVEYKKGAEGKWQNDRIQLCAQALCLEEMLNLKQPIQYGFIFYAASGRRKKINLTKTLRTQTIQAIDALRTLLRTRKRPDVAYSDKCEGCSLYPVCLPKEVETMKRRQRWR